MQNIMKRIAIMTIILPGMIMIAIMGSSTNHILLEYADYPANVATMIITVPTIAVMAGLLLSPVLSRKIPAKIVVLSGLILYSGAAVLGYFAKPLFLLMGLRALQGIAAGLVMPQQATYAAAFPEKERATIMGLSTAVSGIFAVIAILISGFCVAQFGWRSSLLLYLVTLIPLVLAILFLPMHADSSASGSKEIPDRNVNSNGKDSNGKTEMGAFLPVVARYLFYSALLCCVYGIVGVEVAQYLRATGMGGSEVSGLLLGTSFGGTVLAGFITGRFLAVTKRHAISILFLINATGCFIMWLAPNLPLAAMAVLFFGLASGFSGVVFNFEMSKVLPLQVFTAVSAVFGLSAYAMQFFGPMIYSGVMSTLGQDSFRTTYMIYGIVMVLCFGLTKLKWRK